VGIKKIARAIYIFKNHLYDGLYNSIGATKLCRKLRPTAGRPNDLKKPDPGNLFMQNPIPAIFLLKRVGNGKDHYGKADWLTKPIRTH